MPTVADSVDAVIGGDTHVDTTSLSVVSPVGAVIEQITIDNDEQGYAQVVTWILRVVPSGRFLVGLEGTRSYGAGLCRALEAVGIRVVDPRFGWRRLTCASSSVLPTNVRPVLVS